jgi:urease accessory protein
MLLADTYLGHRDDVRPDPAGALAVTLTDEERRRSRVRTETDDGTDLGIVVGETLADGDVIATEGGRPVIVSLASKTALVVDLGDASPEELTAALALGHAAGNRHWDLAIDGGQAYFPVSEDRDRMESEIRPLLPEDATLAYDTVLPALFDDDSGEQGEHAHSGAGHTHGHSHDTGAHSHSHGVETHAHEGGDHSHGHDEGTHTYEVDSHEADSHEADSHKVDSHETSTPRGDR